MMKSVSADYSLFHWNTKLIYTLTQRGVKRLETCLCLNVDFWEWSENLLLWYILKNKFHYLWYPDLPLETWNNNKIFYTYKYMIFGISPSDAAGKLTNSFPPRLLQV